MPVRRVWCRHLSAGLDDPHGADGAGWLAQEFADERRQRIGDSGGAGLAVDGGVGVECELEVGTVGLRRAEVECGDREIDDRTTTQRADRCGN